jgi:hypothetical protein
MAKDIRKLSTAFNRFSRIPGQRFRGSSVPPVAVVQLAVTAPTTIGIDADVEGQINNQQAGDNLLADLGSFMVPAYNNSLSKTPKSLFVLWQEFEVGIAGRKAARLFTRVERGRNKFIYYRRKVVWDSVAEQIRRGYSAQTAIDRIYEVYGQELSVTQIINKMLIDRRTGGKPQLRI